MRTNGSFELLIEMQAACTPKAAAVEFAGDVLTYDQLNRRSNQLAEYLRRSGARPGTKVAVMMDLSVDFFIATLAVFKTGADHLRLEPYASERVDFPPASLVLTDNNHSADLGDYNVIDVSSERGLIACMSDCNVSAPVERHNFAPTKFLTNRR